MLKYYFGYKSSMGIEFPVRWVEDDGKPVGGNVGFIEGNRWEITYKEFTYGELSDLKIKYPYRRPTTE